MARIEITKTELVWPGKYNEDGTRKEVPRVSLPFQVIETINEGRATREANKGGRQLGLFNIYEGREGNTFEEGWKNKLIWGDNLLVMGSLLEKFAGKIDLIYIDPPFATGADFSFTTQVGEGSLQIAKEQSIIEEKAYRDTWGDGLGSYLQMMFDRLSLMKELLSESGSIFVHLDYHVGHYCKILLDGIFGESNIRNEVIWQRTNAHASLDRFGPIHDTIFYYANTNNPIYNDIRINCSEHYVDTFVDRVDAEGRRFMRVPLTAKGTRKGETGLPFRGIDITAKGLHWKYKVSKLEELDAQGKIYWPQKEGGMPRLIV